MGGLSLGHLLIVLVIALLLFGAGRVSEIGKGLGEGIRNFKKGLREEDEAPPPRVAVKRKVVDADVDVDEPAAEAPKLAAAATVAKKKKVIQIEVDEDEDEEEVLRRVAKQKKAAAEGEKTT